MNRRAFDFHNDKHMYPTLKAMGYDEWWSNYRFHRKGGSYTSAKTIGNYKVELEEDDERYPNIYIWNPDSPCVMIGVDKQSKIGVLNRLIYNPKCTIDGRMERGEDTRKMIEFAFKFAKRYGVEKIQLMDKSTFDCHGTEVDLAVHNLFKYGKTWYERCFDFYPTGKYADKFEELRSSIPRIDKPCTYFTKHIIDTLLPKYGINLIHSVSFEKKL